MERARRSSYTFQSLLDGGLLLAFGSDWPVRNSADISVNWTLYFSYHIISYQVYCYCLSGFRRQPHTSYPNCHVPWASWMGGSLDPCGALDPWWITESVSLFRSSHCDAKLCRSMVFPANELVSHSDEHTGIQCLLPTPASWAMPWVALNHGLTEYVCMLLVNSFSNWIIVLLSLWKYVCVLLVPSHNFSPSKSPAKWPVCLWNCSAGY